MQFDFITLTSVGATFIAVLTALGAFLAASSTERSVREANAEHKRIKDLERLVKNWRDQSGDQSENNMDATTGRTPAQLGEILARVENLEDRFPEDASLDKLASINDAILATRLDELSRRVDRLEVPAMTNGDVMKIVLGFISALATVVAISTWVLGQLAT